MSTNPTSDPMFLYVEDEPFSRQVMEILLSRAMGYQKYCIFDNSEQFIERVKALPCKPDLIFLDIHMKPYNGFELLKMLRQHPDYEQTRVVALTASVMNEEVDMLKRAGFDGAIAKPIDQQSFPRIVERILTGEEVWNIV
jgi:two-component system cell cycle response regulator DivK